MNKLTTEQLLFAHKIGANGTGIKSGCLMKPGYIWLSESWNPFTPAESFMVKIDFDPLYNQWIDHDGGGCPVRDDDVVVVFISGATINSLPMKANSLSWSTVRRFKLYRESDWPEQRADAIGQNGNDGEHYETNPEASDGSTASKYHREISPGVWVDVYDVLKAWRVENPALQHLIKKALQPGERGHKTLEQDMDDIIASAKRAKELI